MSERTSLNDLFDELEKCTVGIKVNDSIKGTGIVVSEDGLILTCHHVVDDRDSKTSSSANIKVILSGSEPSPEKPVTYEQDKSNPALDIAFLRPTEKFDNPVVARLEKSQSSFGHSFYAKGFRKPQLTESGLTAKGEIRGLIRSNDNILRLQINCSEISEGMSGSAVLDTDTGRVVGMISLHYKRSDEPTLNFAIPLESILMAFPGIGQRNPGLNTVNRFLKAIGEAESSIYKWIEDVYVPPIEYEEIEESLKSKRIVFITGTKEFGKTFTAVNLMFEYFKQGYQPRWVKGKKDQAGHEGSDPRELARILEEEGYIKSHQIIYFEDPFGKTNYESYSDLESYLGSIIDVITRIEDAYVIITSREEVFKEFVREQRATVDLANFESKMNLKRASYDNEKRKEILLRWAKVDNCRWLREPALVDLVLNATRNKGLLPTPLNIKDFVRASYNVTDSSRLLELMEQKSEETARRFADEIIRMKEDEKVLLLALAHLGEGIDGKLYVGFAKRVYEDIIIEWRESNQKRYKDFDRVRKWFEGDKISIFEDGIRSLSNPSFSERIALSHPSYDEAFESAIWSERNESDRIKDIFVKLLLKLAQEEESGRHIVRPIVANFELLPAALQGLLFKLADKDETALKVAYDVAAYFNKLPPNVREQLLLKLADNDRAAREVASVMANHFNDLQVNIQEQLLLKLADNFKAAKYLSQILEYNFNDLPPNVREQLLLGVVDKDEFAGKVASVIAEHYNDLPPPVQQLLFKLADRDETAWVVAYDVAAYFNKLPPPVQQLLFKLADNDIAADGVVRGITHYYNDLPPPVQQLLFKLADKDRNAEFVASQITRDFDSLPPPVQQLLFKLAEKDETADALAGVLISHMDSMIPPNIREQLLLKLADKDKTALSTSLALMFNNYFNELSSSIREQLLLKLTDIDKSGVSIAIIKNFNNLPSDVRQKVGLELENNNLIKFGDNDEISNYVYLSIVEGFSKLPDAEQELLFKLADKHNILSKVLSLVKNCGNNLPENTREQILSEVKEKGIK